MAVIKGSWRDDELFGTDEADGLRGFGGNDILRGRRGDDNLDGGEGADLMIGRYGNDTYWVDDADDQVVERRDEGFADLVRSTATFILPTDVENLVLSDSAAINGTGNDLDNRIIGNDARNRLDGRAGTDRLEGRGGNDTYIVDTFDATIELSGEGTDTVRLIGVANEYILPDNIENLKVVNGHFADGNELGNVIIGNDRNNFFDGRDGNDLITTGDGTDRIDGGAGNDQLVAGAGDDRIIGGEGNDDLFGGRGQDMLNGGSGRDRLFFDSILATANVDRVEAFSPSEDTICLDRDIFTEIEAGVLDPDAFHVGTAAGDGEDRIIYDQQRGRILYDPDGTGEAEALLVATTPFFPTPVLTHQDFVGYG